MPDLGVDTLDERAWLDRLEALPSYSYFVTPSWARSVAGASLGYRWQTYEFNLGHDRALMPVAVQTNRLAKTVLQSGPYGTYGGLIPLGNTVKHGSDLGAAVASHLRATRGFGVLMAYPGPHDHYPLPKVSGRYSAYVLRLEGRAEAIASDALASMRPKSRQYIRKAEREGVRVACDQSLAGFANYYRLLELSARRWGLSRPNKPWSLFESICRNSQEDNVRLWIAQVGGEFAAGLLCFYGKGEAFAWSAALDERHEKTRANFLLHWRAIGDAAARGFSTFNLGANENLSGVRWFKEGLGATAHEYPAYIVASLSYSALVWPVRRFRRVRDALGSIGIDS